MAIEVIAAGAVALAAYAIYKHRKTVAADLVKDATELKLVAEKAEADAKARLVKIEADIKADAKKL